MSGPCPLGLPFSYFLLGLVLFLFLLALHLALSKNAISFFLCEVISQASAASSSSSSSSSASVPSNPSPSSSSTGSSRAAPSVFHAPSVRGVAASVAFARNVSLSSVLVAATWSSSTVFTSFYLKDMQFSSPQGFNLGLVVAAGAVV